MKAESDEDLTELFYEEILILGRDSSNPEALLLETADALLLRQALEELPVKFHKGACSGS